jgi:uncharacterized Rmd1/YagE family protein
MSHEIFEQIDTITARVMFLGQRLDLQAFEHMAVLASAPLTVSAGSHGVVVLFRYGVVVMFGMNAAESVSFLEHIRPLVVDAYRQPESDDVEVFVDANEAEGYDKGRIRIHAFNLQRLQIIADVLAKSVVLAHYEVSLAKHFDRIEPLAASLNQNRRVGHKGKELLQHIGDTLSIESKMVGRVEVSEKPELIWDYPEYERLYLRLEDEYELSERHTALDRKLALITRTAETLLGLLQNQRSLRVEWYIVILIIIEILITLSEKLFGI